MRRLTRPPVPTGLGRLLPVIGATRTYRRSFLRPDLLAGLTAWAMVVPEGIGYASIAGMPPEAALYAAVLGTFAYFIFGTSHEVTVGPSSALAIMSAATVAGLGIGQSSADWIATTSALAILVGAMSLIAGFLRLGFINNFISKPVLDGFVAGLALNILVGQVPKFFGFEIGGDLNFFQSVGEIFGGLSGISVTTFAVGAGSIALLIWMHTISSRLPAALITVAVSVVAVSLFGLTDHGVAVIGNIPSGLPAPDVPAIGLDTFSALLPGALGIMLVAYAETLSGGRTFAVRRGYRIDPDQEFTALGWANIGAGLFQGFGVNGSLSRTKLKYDVGVRTQYSTLFTGIAVLITILFLTWFFENLAEATIAAIVIHAVAPLVRPRSWPALWRNARFEFWAALAAALVTMSLGEIQGLFFGVLVAIVLVSARASAAPVAELGYRSDLGAYTELTDPKAERVPRTVVLRAAATPFFANASAFHDKILDAVYDADPSPDAVVLDFDVVTSIDLTAAGELNRLADEIAGLKVQLRLARVSPAVSRQFQEQDVDVDGVDNAYPTVREAVEATRDAKAG